MQRPVTASILIGVSTRLSGRQTAASKGQISKVIHAEEDSLAGWLLTILSRYARQRCHGSSLRMRRAMCRSLMFSR
jgi:hypothetical protein